MNNGLLTDNYFQTKITKREIKNILGNFIKEKAGLTFKNIGRPVEGPAPMELEYSVWDEKIDQYLLVFRSNQNLEKCLPVTLKFCQFKAQNLVATLALLLMSKIIEPATINQSGDNLRICASTKNMWPAGKPLCELAVLILNVPAEVRLWRIDKEIL
jgi:hypothetical protein